MVFERKGRGGRRAGARTVGFVFRSGVGDSGAVTRRQISVVVGESVGGGLGEGKRLHRVKGKVSRPVLSCRKLFMSLNKMMLLLPVMKNLSVCVCMRSRTTE